MPHQYDRSPLRRQPYGTGGTPGTPATERGAFQVVTPPPSFGAPARTESFREPAARGDTALDRIGGWLRKLIYASADTHTLMDLAAAIQRPVTTGRRIAVVAEREDARASTLAALLALVFAHYRHDRVLAVDGGRGAMESRLGADDPARARWPREEDPCPGVVRAGENLWVPAEPAEGLDRYFGVTVIDADPGTPAHVTVVARSRGIILLPDGERLRVAYDRHLSSATRIDPALLAEETRLDVARIAAGALEAAQ